MENETQNRNYFKPRARIIKILGQELISSDIIALVELVKNSYDADSVVVDVNLNNIDNDHGEIIIKDFGIGMSKEKILNVWLEPATPDKKSDNTGVSYSKIYKRRYLGEKGIGRFAAHRLGNSIQLITRSAIIKELKVIGVENYETELNIDWEQFTEDKYLEDIPVNVQVRKPEIFEETSGTYIKIKTSRIWPDKDIKGVVTKLRSLESPVRPERISLNLDNTTSDPGIEINISSDSTHIQKIIDDVKPISEILDTAFYTFHGLVEPDGQMIYNYKFERPDVIQIKRTDYPDQIYDITGSDNDYFERYLNDNTSPGSFEVRLYAWDLDRYALNVANLASTYRDIIKPNGGIRIFRENFRVWTYGEPDNDWLNLDLKRLNYPKSRTVSRNQILGFIHISSSTNSELKDQSNREGLVNNIQFQIFTKMVEGIINQFAVERKKDKIKIDRISKKERASDSVTLTIKSLEKRLKSDGYYEKYGKYVKNIEEKYHKNIEDILERLMMSAAIGISVSLPIHEIKSMINNMDLELRDYRRQPFDNKIFLNNLTLSLQEIKRITDALSSLMSRQSLKNVKVMNIIENIELLKHTEFKKHDIKLIKNIDNNYTVRAIPGLFNSMLYNIFDNSIYWLRYKKKKMSLTSEEYMPTITISGEKQNNQSIVRIKDNGIGFEDPFEYLIEPYYSRKTDGIGLGLYLVNQIMIKIGGRLKGYNDIENDKVTGAIIELTFNNSKK